MVELKGFGHFQHLVPVSLVRASAAHCVSLRCTLVELANTAFFTRNRTSPCRCKHRVDDGRRDDVLAARVCQLATSLLHYERFPSGGLSVHRHTLVEATDGPVGDLLAFVLQEPDHRVTNVILQRG